MIKGGFSHTMRSSGRMLGTRFRPFLGGPVSRLSGRFLEIGEVFGRPGRPW
ncbi:hypothetical protein ACQPZZ_17650 [Microbispora sp. CA-135349]|uniref:hypothetical protein n=1 Tax=Microbispora sp. CA-135349 TaxID=3239953 RepID=UPI003D93C019